MLVLFHSNLEWSTAFWTLVITTVPGFSKYCCHGEAAGELSLKAAKPIDSACCGQNCDCGKTQRKKKGHPYKTDTRENFEPVIVPLWPGYLEAQPI